MLSFLKNFMYLIELLEHWQNTIIYLQIVRQNRKICRHDILNICKENEFFGYLLYNSFVTSFVHLLQIKGRDIWK